MDTQKPETEGGGVQRRLSLSLARLLTRADVGTPRRAARPHRRGRRRGRWVLCWPPPPPGLAKPTVPLFHVLVPSPLQLVRTRFEVPCPRDEPASASGRAVRGCALSPPSAPHFPFLGSTAVPGKGHRCPGTAPSEGSFHLQLGGPRTREEW